jgi:hypothetical protein
MNTLTVAMLSGILCLVAANNADCGAELMAEALQVGKHSAQAQILRSSNGFSAAPPGKNGPRRAHCASKL